MSPQWLRSICIHDALEHKYISRLIFTNRYLVILTFLIPNVSIRFLIPWFLSIIKNFFIFFSYSTNELFYILPCEVVSTRSLLTCRKRRRHSYYYNIAVTSSLNLTVTISYRLTSKDLIFYHTGMIILCACVQEKVFII